MIRPAAFDYNPETAVTNTLQQPGVGSTANELARAESLSISSALESAGVAVCAVEDSLVPPKPDAVFPNNWVSFHEDGTVVLYPMQARSRRSERRRDVVEAVNAQLGFNMRRVLDYTHHEASGRYLEGTGSLVLDRVNRVAYACRSPRTHLQVLEEWARELEYEPVVFDAFDCNGVPIYHTNVVMGVGARSAVVGMESIAAPDRARVRDRLESTGHEVIELGQKQIGGFAGNVLEMQARTSSGECRHLWIMSTTAQAAFGEKSLARLRANTDDVLTVSLPTIEKLGGGGVRCMIAEVFLPA